MNRIPYEKRCETYRKALAAFGDQTQLTVAIEELAECQQAICKILRGGENFKHLAEKVAEATIAMEKVRQMFNINDDVCECMDMKVQQLEEKIERYTYGRNDFQ